jgi:glycosyltransferase involved in cell wall biosynthesis
MGLKNCSIDMSLFSTRKENDVYYFCINDTIYKKCKFKRYYLILMFILLGFLRKHKYDFVYIRYHSSMALGIIPCLKLLKYSNAVVFLEIPTYPYDGEKKDVSGIKKLFYMHEKRTRKKFKKYIDRIVTFSADEYIFGTKTIKISNGINWKDVNIARRIAVQGRIRLLSVARISWWHGYDRIISGLHEYYKLHSFPMVELTLIGDGDKPNVISGLKVLSKEKDVDQYIHFVGPVPTDSLDEYFDVCDVAIGALGVHRKGLTRVKALKSREYAARGVPFVYSEIDDDFEDKNYILKVPATDDPVDITRIVDFFYKTKKIPSSDIRNSVSFLDWDIQMKAVYDELMCIL